MLSPTTPHRMPRVLELDLTRELLEAPPATPLAAVRARQTPVLGQVIQALRDGAADRNVVGLVAHVAGRVCTLAQADEIRGAVAGFRAAGKPTWCWSETYGELGPGNVAYLLATAFEEIWIQPSGDVGLMGVVADALFVREALDKLGVEPQFGQRHEFKSAADLFMKSAMTDAHRAMVERLTASATDHIVEEVATARGLTVGDVRAVIDRAPVDAATARNLRLVDRIGYRDEVYAAVEGRLGEVRRTFVHRYPRGPELKGIERTVRPGRPVVAVVRAVGPIHLGRSGRGPWSSGSIGSDTMGAALRAAAADDDVKAVVLRIDSPGGSYVASDAIRREVLQLRSTGKPVVASMASVAASGGYFIAMPADSVVANAGTVTGSIGVLAGKMVTRAALERVGLRHQTVSVGRFAEMLSPQRPFTDEEWERLGSWLDRVYADFTGKAAQDRGLSEEAMDQVARGRVWTGRDAAERGLVDEVGGLDHAVALACRKAGLRRADVDVQNRPHVNLVERIRPAKNSDQVGASAGMGLGDLEARLLAALGLSPYGVLALPVEWRLR